MSELVFYGVVALIVINVSMFTVLLVNKVKNNRREDVLKRNKEHYWKVLDATLRGEGEGITRPATPLACEALKEVLLDAFDYYGPNSYEALKIICRQIGFVKDELKGLTGATALRRAIAAYSLGVMRVEEALPFLLKMEAQDPVLLQSIHRSILQIGGKKHIAFILSRVDITEIQQKTRVMELFTEVEGDIFEEMLKYLQGEDILKKALALEVLASRKEPRVKPFIHEGLLNDQKEIRISALKAAISIRCFDCSAVRGHLQNLLQDENWEVRSFLAKVMSYASDPTEDVLEGLSELMKDSNWNVRFNASESLLSLGEKGIEVLSDHLFSEDRFAREKAYDVLHREWNLFQLEKKISEYANGDKIKANIKKYQEQRMEVEHVL